MVSVLSFGSRDDTAIMMRPQATSTATKNSVAPSPGELLPTAKRWVLGAARRGRTERDDAPTRWIGRPDRAARVLEVLDAVRLDLPPLQLWSSGDPAQLSAFTLRWLEWDVEAKALP